VLYGYPLDGVVLTIGCDKTTPACLMAAATVDIPAIALSVGPMLNGWHKASAPGSGTIIWKARQMMAAGEIDYAGFLELVASSTPRRLLQHDGYCHDDELAGGSARNAVARIRSDTGSVSPATAHGLRNGKRSSSWWARRAPSSIMTRDAFLKRHRREFGYWWLNQMHRIHLAAIARHLGVELSLDDWQTLRTPGPAARELQPQGIPRRRLTITPAVYLP